jgi:hypothetical protein
MTDTTDLDAPLDGLDVADTAGEADGPGPDLPADTTVDDPGDVTGEEDQTCTLDEECLDDNPCTDDYCHPSFHVCVNEPIDGRDCSPEDICEGVGTCDEEGVCVMDSSPLCDDHNECTFDTCLTGATDCEYEPLEDGTVCDNHLYCDGDDHCSDGICMAAVPSYRACADGDPCTLDTCAEGDTGPVCSHEAVEPFKAVACGETVSGITSGSGELDSYGSCSGSLGAGPEDFVVFTAGEATDVTFSLVMHSGVDTAEDNELYLLADGCDPSTCSQGGATSVTAAGVAADSSVYVVVESVEGGALFAVRASCE